MRPTGCGGTLKYWGTPEKRCRKGVYWTDEHGQGWCYSHDPRPETVVRRQEHADRGSANTQLTHRRRRMMARLKAGGAWLPTAENINSLPQPLRDYIHDLETMVDPAGMVRENMMLRDRCTQLELLVQELKQGV